MALPGPFFVQHVKDGTCSSRLHLEALVTMPTRHPVACVVGTPTAGLIVLTVYIVVPEVDTPVAELTTVVPGADPVDACVVVVADESASVDAVIEEDSCGDIER